MNYQFKLLNESVQLCNENKIIDFTKYILFSKSGKIITFSLISMLGTSIAIYTTRLFIKLLIKFLKNIYKNAKNKDVVKKEILLKIKKSKEQLKEDNDKNANKKIQIINNIENEIKNFK